MAPGPVVVLIDNPVRADKYKLGSDMRFSDVML
ncbi:hypothetical protein OICFNHDK_2432 [Methylobacterium bullatum]|uniref:Uncharacterized protein n=1 Tax=Methylobacterium bullatum TaxID=570505 RepID=A0AAV4Z8D1_9HYPH|nr:hypothetical protein OICFNHDK_2432 [Methylobacterium bullatum]